MCASGIVRSRRPVEDVVEHLTAILPTRLGPMLAVVSERGLCGLEFNRPERATRLWRRLGRWHPGADARTGESDAFSGVARWLNDYFARRWAACEHSPLPLDLLGTPFERAVWGELRRLGPGRTLTYGAIGSAIGRRDGARAVGAAVGANPVSLIVPCHRVIGANGSLTGYGGGLDRKEWLLRHEGALLL